VQFDRLDLELKNLSFTIYTVDGTKQSQVEAKLMKDGKALPLKDVEIIVGEDKITYKIKKPQRESSGIYQIKIGNNQGEEMKDVNIVMQGSCNALVDQKKIEFLSYHRFSQMSRLRHTMSKSTRFSRTLASYHSNRQKMMAAHQLRSTSSSVSISA